MPRNKDGNKLRRTLRKRNMRLGTWNIQGIRTKQTEVFKELKEKDIDICVLTETKKKGKGNEKIGDYIHFYSGVEKSARAKRGVSIAVHKKYERNIKCWEEIDEQIIKMEIEKNGERIVIVGVYAPSEDAEIGIKDDFYDKLSNEVLKIKTDKEIFILGDLNARVGQKEGSYVVGRYGEQKINDNGQRLIEMCEFLNFKIMNGFFQHKDIHKFTWVQPKKGLRSIIDYVLQQQKSRVKTEDVRVYRGAECGTDHHLVIATIRVNYRKNNSPDKKDTNEVQDEIKYDKYNLESLKDQSTQFLYKLRLATKLQNTTEVTSVENKYQGLKDDIHQAAKEALGYQENTNKQNPEWWSEEIKELVERKKTAYQKWLSTNDPRDRELYATINKEVKKTITRSKNELWERKCEEVERCIGGARVSQAWKTIKNLRKDRKDSGSIALIKAEEWRQHYKKLFTEDRPEFREPFDEVFVHRNENIEFITKIEVKKALQEMKNGKSSGPGNIPVELLKHGPEVMIEEITDIFNECFINGQDIPTDWNMAFISSIYKKGNRQECGNYRGISVTSSIGRLYGRILKKRIEAKIEEIEEQSGFRAGRSCTDNIFTLQQIIEKRKARNLATHLVFIDLEKAYDMVPLKRLFECLTKIGLEKTYIRAIQNIYRRPECTIKIGKKTTKPFAVTKGLKQGCCVSPTLFKIYIQEALREWRQKCTGMGVEVNGQCLATLFFADDQVIIANSEDDIDYMLRKLREEYGKWGMNMNLKKTEYMCIGSKSEEDPELQLRNMKECDEYKYLGSIISKEGTSNRDIAYRVQQGQKSVRILNPLLWSDQLKMKTKMTMYQCIVEPIMTYGAECWQLSSSNKRKIETVEMDFLRRASKISRLDHIPNEEIRRRTNRIHTTVERIETRQLIWYGHVMRMEECRWPKRAFNYVPPNRRKRGRPTKTWIEGIRNTLKDRAIGEEEWKERDRWRSKCGMRQRL